MAATSALDRLRAFAKGGVVLEGSGPRLAAAALAVMAVTASAPAPATAAPGAVAQNSKVSTAAAADSSYRQTLADVRAQVEAEFPGQIFIVDRSAEPRAEAARLGRVVGLPAGYGHVAVDELQGDAHAKPFEGERRRVCLVVGAEPGMSAREINGLPADMPIRLGELTDEAMQRYVLWHEVGHCLVGLNEAKADAFASMKTMMETKSTKFVQTMTVVREFAEWLGPKGDSHGISPALRGVMAGYGDEAFMNGKRSLRELARLAKSVPNPDTRLSAKVRDVLSRDERDPDRKFFVPVRDGYVAAPLYYYLKASASVPEFGRIASLCDYLMDDPGKRTMPGPYVADPARSGAAIAALAAAGDPMARRMAPIFGAKAPPPDAPIVTTDALPSAKDVQGNPISFDRTATVIKFSHDFRGFLVREAATGRPLFAGSAAQGVTKTFPAKPPSPRYDASVEPAVPAAPRI